MSGAVLLHEEQLPAATRSSLLRDLAELTKARIVLAVLVTTTAGFIVAANGAVDVWLLLNALLGTALVAAGTNALNQYVERDFDRLMARTRNRPLPAGRLSDRFALFFAMFISLFGTVYLAVLVNVLAAALAAFTLVSYLFVYTPLKRRTTLCTVVGAVPGAIPPMIGWAAAVGSLDTGAWVLFALMFLWQLPHFMAISWIYRDDYSRAGFEMVSVHDADGSATSRQAAAWAVAMVPMSVVPFFVSIAGQVYLAGAILASLALLAAAVSFARVHTSARARRLFLTSNVYLMAIMILLVAGRI